jgi:hypothetical protein
MEDSANRQLLPASKVDKLLRKADEDQDGYLDYNEFVTLVRFPHFSSSCASVSIRILFFR